MKDFSKVIALVFILVIGIHFFATDFSKLKENQTIFNFKLEAIYA